jgi:RNA polymerase sigma factor (sigma-70 family)
MERSDAELVAESLAGNREAFARIVETYQSLVCSLAYSGTGSLSQSEDLAQETFLIAWRELRQLREPEKLRSWLCSIARSVISNALRRQVREPAHAAQPLELADNAAVPSPSPSEAAIQREEETILWRSLEKIPATYREPLILFYREQESVASVAAKLQLSEDNVRQRLSRGRKLLTDEVAVFVEGLLKRSTPGKAFTVAVVASLPAFTGTTSAAAMGATAGKSVAAAKAAASIGLAGAISGPLLGLLGGWLGAQISLENTASPRERKFVVKMAWITLALAGVFCLGVGAFAFAVRFWWNSHPLPIALGFIGALLAYGAALTTLVLWANRAQQRIRAEESAKAAPGTQPPDRSEFLAPFSCASYEYRSRQKLLGLPLIHVSLGMRPEGRRLPAKGWIAIGEIAYGAFLGLGSQFAVAPISLAGGAAVGGLALGGGAAAGALAVGGGLAAGVFAVGGCAVGWMAALGGLAVARHVALGGAALAARTNDLSAFGAFLPVLHAVKRVAIVAGLFLNVAMVVAMFWLLNRMRAQRSRRGPTRESKG